MWKSKSVNKIAAFMAAILLSTALGGCGSKAEPGSSPSGQKGRYVETQLSLPEGITANDIFQIYKKEGNVHILTNQDDGGMSVIKDWKYGEGSFQESTGEWMKQLQIPYAEYWKGKLFFNEKGNTYFYAAFVSEGEEMLKGHLWNVTDGSSLTDITPEGWKKVNEQYGYTESPEDMVILENDVLVGIFYSRKELYQPDGSLIKSVEFQNMYNYKAVALKDNYYMLQDDGTGKTAGLDVFTGDKDEPVKNIPIVQKSNSNVYSSVLDDGTVILCNGDGFFRCGPESAEWVKFVEGVDTSMAISNMWCKGVQALDDGSVFALYGGENGGGGLMQYAFDPEAEVLEVQTIELFSVGESFMLQNAAVLFHKKHPEVIINVETAVTFQEEYEGTADYNQIFQDLNTKLLAGKGPDILVMDGLDMNSFTEKGLLADINDIVNPLEESGELLSNITKDYVQEDGKRFIVPLQFSMVLAVARDLDVESMKDIPSLAAALSNKSESYMGKFTAAELVDLFLPYFAGELVNGKELNKEKLKENLEYLKTIAANCGMIESRGEEERAWNIWELASKSKLAFYENSGFNGSMLPISMKNLIKGTFTPFEDAYYPLYQIGINAKSEKLDIAKEFLAFALSQEIQNQDYYQGFPVNNKSLEYQSKLDRSNAIASTGIEIEEGMYEEFKIDTYSQEEADQLMDACRKLNNRAVKDKKIREEIAAALPGFLNGTQSLDDTVSMIEGSLRMYLAE